jgi:hypothetical protein
VPTFEHSVVEDLNRRCQCVGTDVHALRDWLDNDLRHRGVTEPIVMSHPHLFSELPVFVANEQVAAMRRVIEAIESVVGTPQYRDAVLANAPPIARYVPKARGVFLGYDFHISSSGPKLIEINTNAGGAMLNVAMTRAQQACCPEVAEYLRTQTSASELEEHFYAMFQEEWRLSRADRQLRTVAIVDESPRTQYLYPEFLLFQRLFAARGVHAVIVGPEEFEYREGELRFSGLRIDLVYSRLTDFYLQSPAHTALAQAYLDGAVVMSPHPHAYALYANKHNLALLTDTHALREMNVPGDVIATLLGGIPETRAVSAADAELWWADRKQWFFKPASGFGSRGSYRGDKLTRKVFAEIVQGDYVAQRLAAPSERWLSSEAESALKFDVRNYVYNGATQLMAARLYQGQTTNFRTPGGGFAPVYSLSGSISSMPSAA